MDLLDENQYNTKVEKSKGKKMILALLIISILLVIAIIITMIYIESNKVIPDTLAINGQMQEITTDIIVTDEQGDKYISIKDLCSFLGYEYNNSAYQTYIPETTKCYVKNGTLITGFELNSNKIYKYEEGTNLDYQYYILKKKILINNNKLYIAIQDLPVALNATSSINSNKLITINSMEGLVKSYGEKLKEKGYTISPDLNNQKAISYGVIIASKNNSYSLLNTNLQEIINEKYASIYFDEQNLNYIVSNTNGKYGIITDKGQIKQILIYDNLQILNYENMLYKVKHNNQYGIMKADGTLLTDIVYEDIGYPADRNNDILYTLIIPEIGNLIKKETIVVKQSGKYGLIYLENGQTVLPCDELDKLYAIKDLGVTKYVGEREKERIELSNYLEYRGMQTVELN